MNVAPVIKQSFCSSTKTTHFTKNLHTMKDIFRLEVDCHLSVMFLLSFWPLSVIFLSSFCYYWWMGWDIWMGWMVHRVHGIIGHSAHLVIIIPNRLGQGAQLPTWLILRSSRPSKLNGLRHLFTFSQYCPLLSTDNSSDRKWQLT